MQVLFYLYMYLFTYGFHMPELTIELCALFAVAFRGSFLSSKLVLLIWYMWGVSCSFLFVL